MLNFYTIKSILKGDYVSICECSQNNFYTIKSILKVDLKLVLVKQKQISILLSLF